MASLRQLLRRKRDPIVDQAFAFAGLRIRGSAIAADQNTIEKKLGRGHRREHQHLHLRWLARHVELRQETVMAPRRQLYECKSPIRVAALGSDAPVEIDRGKT